MKTLELVGLEGCKWAAMFGRTIFRAAVEGFAGFGKSVLVSTAESQKPPSRGFTLLELLGWRCTTTMTLIALFRQDECEAPSTARVGASLRMHICFPTLKQRIS